MWYSCLMYIININIFILHLIHTFIKSFAYILYMNSAIICSDSVDEQLEDHPLNCRKSFWKILFLKNIFDTFLSDALMFPLFWKKPLISLFSRNCPLIYAIRDGKIIYCSYTFVEEVMYNFRLFYTKNV